MTPAPVGIRCPEHSGKPQGLERVTRAAERSRALGRSTITMVLIGINVAVYLAELAAGGSIDGTNNWIFFHGALYGPLVANGDWWRLFTAMFLHYGPLHLGLNMYSLYWVGTVLERVIGPWRFLGLYLASGLAGSAGALILTPNAVTVGASGAIFGILGALFVLERQGHIQSGGQIVMLIVLNLVLTFAFSGFALGGSATGLQISLGGHLGGLIGGAVGTWFLLKVRRSSALSAAVIAAVAIVSVILAYASVH
jgi:membrane associated rhomboid family serine protease